MELKKSKKSKKDIIDSVSKYIFLICACASVAAVVLISLYMIISGLPAIFKIGFKEFFLGTIWNPTGADPKFGILPMILSSIFATFGAILIGVPIGIFVAVFLAEIAPKKLAKAVKPAVELLAGIPSVIYGLLGMLIVVPFVAQVFNLSFGMNLFTAILILSVMILPTIINIAQVSLESVPKEYKEASLALGATDITTIFKIMIPAAKSGIITSIVLGVGRAIGETMAVIMVAGNVVNMPKFFESVRFLTTGIAMEMSYAEGLHRDALFSIGLVLFVFILIINIVINVILKPKPEKEKKNERKR